MAKEKKNKSPELLTIHKVAEMLKVHPETLRRWDNEGRLKAIRVGSRRGKGDRRYRRKDIEKVMMGDRI